ncbi:MAG: hypothetical protein ACQKBW_02760, partial [Puniceicoccales bacterium]
MADKSRFNLTGWVEFDLDIPVSGWYELWSGGNPPEWPRDIFVDGDTIVRLEHSHDSDILENPERGEVSFKDVNLYFTKGKHTLRIRRLGFPGMLPTILELRPADGNPAGCIRVSYDGSRLVNTGESVTLKVLGGTTIPTSYDLFLVNEVSDDEIPVGSVSFAAMDRPIEKSVAIKFPKEGFYSIIGKADGEQLKPSDLKAGYFMVGDVLEDGRRVLNEDFRFGGVFADNV